MTLDTHVVIKNPDVHPSAVLALINRDLLGAPHPIPLAWPPPWLDADYLAEHYADVTKLGNRVGQGLAALVEITVRQPVAPITADYMTGWTSDGRPDTDYEDEDRADLDLVTGAMVVSFDTAYGWHEGDARCNDLHAHFITRLAEQYGPVAWLNEYRGTWHPFSPDGVPEEWALLVETFGNPRVGWEAMQAGAAVAG